MRPAAVFSRPDMKACTDRWNMLINRMFTEQLHNAMWPEAGLSLADIDQLLGGYYYSFQPKNPEGSRHTISANLRMIRTVQDFDWPVKMRNFAPDLMELKHAGKSYYRSSKSAFPHLGIPLCFFVPDSRTIVVDSEDKIRRLLEKKPSPIPSAVWQDGWRQVEHAILAVAIDNRDPRWTDLYKGPAPKEPEIDLLFRSKSQIVLGIDYAGTLDFTGAAKCESVDAAKKMAERIVTEIKSTAAQLSKQRNENADATDALFRKFGVESVEPEISQQGSKVEIRCKAELDLVKLMNAIVE